MTTIIYLTFKTENFKLKLSLMIRIILMEIKVFCN